MEVEREERGMWRENSRKERSSKLKGEKGGGAQESRAACRRELKRKTRGGHWRMASWEKRKQHHEARETERDVTGARKGGKKGREARKQESGGRAHRTPFPWAPPCRSLLQSRKEHNERASEEKKKRQKSRTSGACLVLGLVAELVALGCAEKRKGAGG